MFAPTLPISRWATTKQPWALITGGGGGVGRGFGEELARKGFNVLLIDISEKALNDCKQAIQTKYPKVQVETKVIDFSKNTNDWIPDIRRLIDQKEIAVLVNNVGINTEIPIVFTDHNIEHVNKMVQVNCSSMLALTNLILPIMEEKRKGAIIFMSSSSGIHETPMMAIYSATKAFIYQFAHCLSDEVAPKHIDVLVLHPFYVKTDMSGFRHTSFFVVTNIEYARKALQWLGRAVDAQPIFSHLLLDILFAFVPKSIGRRVRLNKMKTAAAKLLRRRQRENAKPKDNSYLPAKSNI